MVNELDPLVPQAAAKIVAAQKYSVTNLWDWFGYSIELKRTTLIEHQLCECGIIERQFERTDDSVLVGSQSQLNAIFRKSGGRSLLSMEDKQRLNDYYTQRQQELIGEHELCSVLHCDEDKVDTYASVGLAYDTLTKCEGIWEIVSSQTNTAQKSSASTLVDRKNVYSNYRHSFNFLKPLQDTNALYFEFKHGGFSFYLYPSFVIAARSAINFDVIELKDVNISFKKHNFIETINALIPKDAKLSHYTYKYVNKNGDRDARYTDNPRYGVYEYGDLTFYPQQLTMEFSSSELAENFYKKFISLQIGGNDYTDANFGATEQYFNTANAVAKQMN